MENPLLVLVMLGTAWYIGKLWRDDLRSPHDRGLPGTTRASLASVIIPVAGLLGLLAIETAGEKVLGVSEQQSKMTWLFAVYSIGGAPLFEELVFRGYLVIRGRGKAILWTSILLFSVGFALLHQFLWKWNAEGFSLTIDQKGLFSTAVVFATSLWLYAARFAPWNPTQSLLPCFLAHAA